MSSPVDSLRGALELWDTIPFQALKVVLVLTNVLKEFRR